MPGLIRKLLVDAWSGWVHDAARKLDGKRPSPENRHRIYVPGACERVRPLGLLLSADDANGVDEMWVDTDFFKSSSRKPRSRPQIASTASCSCEALGAPNVGLTSRELSSCSTACRRAKPER